MTAELEKKAEEFAKANITTVTARLTNETVSIQELWNRAGEDALRKGYLAGAARTLEQRRKDFEAGRTIDRSCLVDGRGLHPWLYETFDDYIKKESNG